MSRRNLIATHPWPREVALPARAKRARIERGGPQLTGSKGTNETHEWMILAATLPAAQDRDGYRAACA